MTSPFFLSKHFSCYLVALAALPFLSGCGVEPARTNPAAAGSTLRGHVLGGQQPIAGALVQVYAASVAGDGMLASPLLSPAAVTNSQGEFNLPANLGCTSPSSLLYIVSSGGNPGLASGTINHAATLMSAFGACGDYTASSFININELTTVAAVFSLAPFMHSYTAIGSATTDQPQLALAFAHAAQLVNSATGTSPGLGLPTGITVPVQEIATIADVLAPCVNSPGGVAGDHSSCGDLFSDAQPASGSAATETIGAALQMAQNPTNNVSTLFGFVTSNSPYQLPLSTAPAAWNLAPSAPFFSLYVDPATQHLINPNIYGIVSYNLNAAFAAEIKVPNQRWGGDGTTRYNWLVDSTNSGDDFYFLGGNGQTNPVQGASSDAMIRATQAAGGTALMTIPIIPWINSTAAYTCSFRVSVYGAQQATNPYVHPNGDSCGNSISTSGQQLLDSNIPYNHIANSPGFQQAWVRHLVSTFGTAAQGGVGFYQLDNEPGGWSNTHRDVQPTAAPYSQIASLGTQYAAGIKQIDPSAAILGPSDFTLGGWIGVPSQQNGLFAGEYYLQQFAAADEALGTRTLDYFDEHYYPSYTDATSQLASTRTLWDPTFNGGTFVEQYYFYGPMQLIPRFHQWVATYYPGTKLAISEYSIDSGKGLITDALAQADVLGIFGQQGMDFATLWTPPAPTYSVAYAFRLFRNYDGQGSKFGGNGSEAISTDPTQLAIYASTRATDHALTLVILNKTNANAPASLSLGNVTPSGPAQVYQYSASNLTQIVAEGTVPLSSNVLTYTFPPYSATVIAIPQ